MFHVEHLETGSNLSYNAHAKPTIELAHASHEIWRQIKAANTKSQSAHVSRGTYKTGWALFYIKLAGANARSNPQTYLAIQWLTKSLKGIIEIAQCMLKIRGFKPGLNSKRWSRTLRNVIIPTFHVER